jgi:glycosyltransferase involved in cell wall biosynthesis
MQKQVSIIMATYNRAHFIVETLMSIQSQSHTNWECLIIDDGGTDNTQEVITPILEKDTRFISLKRPESYKKGLPGCRNFGLDNAKGDFIIFFDDDDIIHPKNLEISLDTIEKNQVDYCHYRKKPFTLDKKPVIETSEVKKNCFLSKDKIFEVISNKIPIASCTVLWNKKCFKNIRFNESLQYAEEWECYNRIISENYKGVSINNTLYYNRKHPNSNTGEFFKNNPVRKKSKADAIELVVKNLKERELLSDEIFFYMVNLSIKFSEYNVFQRLIKIADFSYSKNIYYKTIYLKLSFKKKIKSILR